MSMKPVRSFTLSFYNNSSDSFEVQEVSALIGQWTAGEEPRQGQIILTGRVGGPWKTESVEGDDGTGGLLCLMGQQGEVMLHWLFMSDGKIEAELGQDKYLIKSDKLEENSHSNHLIWRFSINDSQS